MYGREFKITKWQYIVALRFCRVEDTVCRVTIFHFPLRADDLVALERNFLDLLVEQEPDERSGVFSTLEEAIHQHEQDFTD